MARIKNWIEDHPNESLRVEVKENPLIHREVYGQELGGNYDEMTPEELSEDRNGEMCGSPVGGWI